MALSDKIKALRKSAKITQRQLSENTGIPFQSIVNYENGRREPNNKAMVALERYFNVSGAYLRGETEDPMPRSWNPLHIGNDIEYDDGKMFQTLEHYFSQMEYPSQRRVLAILLELRSIMNREDPAVQTAGLALMDAAATSSASFLEACTTERPASGPSIDMFRGKCLADYSEALKTAQNALKPNG